MMLIERTWQASTVLMPSTAFSALTADGSRGPLLTPPPLLLPPATTVPAPPDAPKPPLSHLLGPAGADGRDIGLPAPTFFIGREESRS